MYEALRPTSVGFLDRRGCLGRPARRRPGAQPAAGPAPGGTRSTPSRTARSPGSRPTAPGRRASRVATTAASTSGTCTRPPRRRTRRCGPTWPASTSRPGWRCNRAPLDDPLQHIVADVRALDMSMYDSLWVRLADVDRALASRTYSTPVDVVLDVRDEFCPWNAGRWRLSADGSGAVCERTHGPGRPGAVLDRARRGLPGRADAGRAGRGRAGHRAAAGGAGGGEPGVRRRPACRGARRCSERLCRPG